MLLKLLAPLRTDFAIISERPLQAPRQYAAFWDEASNRVQELRSPLPGGFSEAMHEIRFAHRTMHHAMLGNGSMYRTLASDSMARPLHILEVHLSPDHIQMIPDDDMTLKEVVIRVYDHHITLIEADLELDVQLQQLPADAVETHLDTLQQSAILLGEALGHHCNNRILEPLFAWIDSLPDAGEYIDHTARSLSEDRVKWVTRTLVFEPSDAATNRDAIIHHWLINSGGTEEIDGETRIERLQDDPAGHMNLWLNYLFREEAYPARDPSARHDSPDVLARPFCDAWEGLLHAQYYYAALDVVDSHLTTILASAWMPGREVNVDSLKQLLEYNIRNANLLLIQHHDNAKYYRRAVKEELDTILSYWQFDYVLIEPVQNKIGLCESRLQLLLQQEAARSAIFTDMILLGIGITGIFSTFLGLAEFGRTMATDVELASYDVNSPNLIAWLAVQPTDVILVLSLVLSAVLAILYLFFRQQQGAA
jgi:hypothetical protein